MIELVLGIVAVAAGIYAVVWFRRNGRPVWRSFGFDADRGVPIEIGIGLVTPFVAFCGVFGVESALHAIAVGGGTTGIGVVPALAQFGSDALLEELIFRVVLVTGLVVILRRVPAHRWIVVAFSAAVFGAAHLTNPNASVIGAFGTGLGGVIYAVAFLATRKIWLPLFLHLSWNLSQAAWGFHVSGSSGWPGWVTSRSIGDTILNGGEYGPEASLPGMGARVVILAVVMLYVSRRWRNGSLATLTYAPDPVRRSRVG